MNTTTVERESRLTEEVSTVEIVSIVTPTIPTVEIVTIDRRERATLTEVDKSQFSRSREERDGKVPFYTEILPILRGERVTVYRVYVSIQNTYGKESISRMRVYKWLNSLVNKNLATKEFDKQSGEDVYIVK